MNLPDLPHGKAALAIHPSVAGFGWILFDGPLGAVEWSVCMAAARTRGAERKNARCLARAEELLRHFRPATLLLESFEGPGTRRSRRVQNLYHSLISLAAVEGASVRIISRTEIARMFSVSGVKTREQTAAVVASFLKEIRVREPEKRNVWDSERANMALFNAAALGIVHYANPEEPL